MGFQYRLILISHFHIIQCTYFNIRYAKLSETIIKEFIVKKQKLN